MKIEGNNIQKKESNSVLEKEEREERLMRGLPQEYLADPDMKMIAEQVRREIVRVGPKVSFSDVVGLASAKRFLKEISQLPQMFPEVFELGKSHYYYQSS